MVDAFDMWHTFCHLCVSVYFDDFALISGCGVPIFKLIFLPHFLHLVVEGKTIESLHVLKFVICCKQGLVTCKTMPRTNALLLK